MADPHIKSPMDFLDYLTVIIYRTGFVIAALAVLTVSWYPDLSPIYINCGNLLCLFVTHLLKIFSIAFSICYLDGITFYINHYPALALGGALLL